jgi:hypothetical protein
MSFENIKAEISLLLEQMVNQPHDKHELARQVREMLSGLKAEGMPLPDDLVELEARLEKEFEQKP